MFLAERNVEYADKVERRIAARVSMLERFPGLGRPVPGKDNMRELSVSDTQHVIVYRIEEDIVFIMQIWSTAQDRGDA